MARKQTHELHLSILKEIFDSVAKTRKTFLGFRYGWQSISKQEVKVLNEKIKLALMPENETTKKVIDVGIFSCLEACSAQLEFRLKMPEDGKSSFPLDARMPAHTILTSAAATDSYTKRIQAVIYQRLRNIKI